MARGTVPGVALLVLAALLAPLTVASAQGALPPGPKYVPVEGLNIPEGESLLVGPNTTLTGDGAVEVWGRLIVKADPRGPANFTVPVVVRSTGVVEMEHANLWLVNGTALHLTDGRAVLSNVSFEANSRAIFADGAARLEIRDSSFRDHAGEAVYVEDSANVTLERATFTGNGRGLTVYSASRFALHDSDFADNGQHLVIDLGPWSGPGNLSVTSSRFAAPAPTPAQLPSILLRHDAPLADDAGQRTVWMESNRISGAPVGLRAEGQGLALVSHNDSYIDNDIGISVQLATVRLVRATLGNLHENIDGSGRVSYEDPTYLRAGGVSVEPPAEGASWLPWALGGAVALVAAAAILLPRLSRAAAPPPPPRAPPAPRPAPPPAPERRADAPAAAPAPRQVDVQTPLTAVERRILEDVLAHPGTAQRALADRLGMTRQALHYHVKKLEARGLLLKSVEGRETRCTVPPGVASMLSATPVTRTGSQEKA